MNKTRSNKANYIKLYNIDYTVKAVILSIKLLLFFAILLLFAVLFNYFNHKLSEYSGMAVSENTDSEKSIIIIDAGHGGEDGGAIGINGCLEKNINLATSIDIYDLLRVSDIPVVLTRDSDIMLYDNASSGKKKAQDLRKRLEITEKYKNSILVSIHMNSYPSPKYSGTQVYYSPNHSESQKLAKAVQNTVVSALQPGNTREIKPSTSAIFLLDNVTRPAVLVECGFISNQKEAELLCTEEYQRKMAVSIYTSLVNYLSEKDVIS